MQTSKAKGIPKNVRGVIVSTITGKERNAAQEAIAILAESLEALGGPKRDNDGSGAEEDTGKDAEQGGTVDISELLKAEVEDMKDKSKQDFLIRDMGLPSSVFIIFNFASPSPSDVLFHALNAVKKSGQNKSRFCHRWSPIEHSCRAEMAAIEKMAKTVAEEYFGSEREEKSFAVDVQLRAKPKEIERMAVVEAFAGQISQPPWTVDLTAPELTVLVNVVKGTAGCAVLKGYRDLARYNLSALATPQEEAEGTNVN